MMAKEDLSEISLGIDNISIPLLSKDLKGKKKKSEDLSELFAYLSAEANPNNLICSGEMKGLCLESSSSCRTHLTPSL